MKKTVLWTVTAILMLLGSVSAQDYQGTYVMSTESGDISLRIEYTSDGIAGEMLLSGEAYPLQGGIDELGIFGTVFTGEQDLYFEAELQGNGLFMIMALIDAATGQPDPASAGEYNFQRTRAPTATPTGPTAPGRLVAPPAGTPGSGATQAPQAQTEAAAQPAGMVQARIGQRYEAGSRIGSADAGVSFTVPSGFYAGYHPGENAFVVVSDTQPGLISVDARSFMPLDDALQQLSQSFVTGEVSMQPQGTPQITGGTARARFTVSNPQGQMALYVVGLAGSSGNVLIVSGLGLASESSQVEQQVEAIVGSAVFSSPTRSDAADAANRLAGVRLNIGSGASSTGGLGDAHSSSSARLDLCSTGNYDYEYSYRFSARIDGLDGPGMFGGVTASDSDLKQETGRWDVVSGLLGPVLVLHSNQDGSLTYVPLLEEAGVLYADGMAVMTSTSPLCG